MAVFSAVSEMFSSVSNNGVASRGKYKML